MSIVDVASAIDERIVKEEAFDGSAEMLPVVPGAVVPRAGLKATPTQDRTGLASRLAAFSASSLSGRQLVAPLGGPETGAGLSYVPDDVFVANDGNVYLLSSANRKLFRWSPGAREYLAAISLSGAVAHVAYSPESDTIYTGYAGGEVKQIGPGEPRPAEMDFIVSPVPLRGLATAGDLVLVSDPTGTLGSHSTYRPDGTFISNADFRSFSEEHIWNAAKRRIFYLRDDTLPNTLHWESIGVDGRIVPELFLLTNPRGFDIVHPIRVNGAGTRIVTGAGDIFETDAFGFVQALPDRIADGLWLEDDVFLAASRIDGGYSRVKYFSGASLTPGDGALVSGEPHRLLEVPGRLLMITLFEGRPRFSLLDPVTLDALYISPTRPAAAGALRIAGRTDVSLSIGWDDRADNEDGFRIEYRRVGAGAWLDGGEAAPGTIAHAVEGLSPDTEYEFRVIAFNPVGLATASETVGARTRSHADTPGGGPYVLRVTRLFDTSITIEWQDNVADDTGFEIYRLASPDQPIESGVRLTAAAGSTRFTDVGLQAEREYFYRIRVMDAVGTGDLSDIVSARTFASGVVPLAPDSLSADSVATDSVTVVWNDRSLAEDGFVILRSGADDLASAQEVGRTAYGVSEFTDMKLIPGDRYFYWVRAFNFNGESSAAGSLEVASVRLGGEFVGEAMSHDGVYYFAFAGPDRIERYHIKNRSWLGTIPLPGAPVALWIDDDGIYVGIGRDVFRVTETGDATYLITTEEDLTGLYAIDGGHLVASTLLRTQVVLRKSDGALLNDRFASHRSFQPAAVAADGLRVYGRAREDVFYIEYGADINVAFRQVTSTGTGYQDGTRVFLFPDGLRIADDAGVVYDAEDLSFLTSFAGSLVDLHYVVGEGPLVLREDRITAYDEALGWIDSMALESAQGLRVTEDGGEILAFVADGGIERGIAVETYQRSGFQPRQPAAPIDPIGESIGTLDTFADEDGIIYLFDPQHAGIFRWSTPMRRYLETLPLLGRATHAVYSADNHAIYVGYASGEINQIDLAGTELVEQPFAGVGLQVGGLAAAGEYLLAYDSSGCSPASHFSFAPDGTLASRRQQCRPSFWAHRWDETNRRLYVIQGSGPLSYETIAADGSIGDLLRSPEGGAHNPWIVLSPSAERVVIGSGQFFNARTLVRDRSLQAERFHKGLWLSETELVTALGQVGNNPTILRRYSGVNLAPTFEILLDGSQPNLLDAGANTVLVTRVDGRPRFTIFDPLTFELIYVSPAPPGTPLGVSLVGRTDKSIGLGWVDRSDNEDGFHAEFRLAGEQDWNPGGEVAANVTEISIGGLAADSDYEFRIIAFNEAHKSVPSAVFSARTLLGADTPAGEPYNLSATRVFARSITLEWEDNADNETGFNIYRMSSAGQPPASGLRRQVAAGVTKFVDEGLSAGTRYYYRLEAFNPAGGGDLSDELEVRTLSSDNLLPNPAGDFATVGLEPRSVTVGWSDNSLNEDGFIVSRSENFSFSPSIELGRVGYNVTAFADTTVLGGRTYYYRIEAYNSAGVRTSSRVERADTPRVAGEFGGDARLSDGIYYFTFVGPDRVERFDVESRKWLAPIPLPSPAGALWVDADGIYVGLEQRLVRVDEDGGEMAMGETVQAVEEIFAAGTDYIVAVNGLGDYIIVRKADGSLAGTHDSFSSMDGTSALPGSNRVFGISSLGTPGALRVIEFADDGSVIRDQDSPHHSELADTTRTFAFPDGHRVADDAGTVSNTSDLTHNGFLSGALIDLDFIGGDVPVVLREDQLVAFTNTLVPTGAVDLDDRGLRVAVSGDSALVFFDDGNEPNGLRVERFPLANLNAAEPGAAKDPVGLAFTPDEIFIDREGILHLFSKSHYSVFRWSIAEGQYLKTLPLSGTANFIAYSAETHTAYTAYQDGKILQVDLGAGTAAVEQSLVNLPSSATGLATAGEILFVARTEGHSTRHITYSPGGLVLSQPEISYLSPHYVWNSTNRNIYFFRPDDIHFRSISTGGDLGAIVGSQYDEPFPILPPIRVSPDGSVLVTGSGRLYDANTLETTGTLYRRLGDITWLGESMITAESLPGGEATRLTMWGDEPQRSVVDSILIGGEQHRLLTLDDGRILAITKIAGVPTMTILDAGLGVEFESGAERAPEIVEQPKNRHADWGASVRLEVGVIGTRPLTFEWSKGGEPIPDSNLAVLTLDEVSFADAGDFSVRISNAHGEVRSETLGLIIGRSGEAFFTPGNLLVSHDSQILEYTPDGRLVQSLDFPRTGSPIRDGTDLVVDRFGRVFVFVFDGTTAPGARLLSVFDPSFGTWDHWPDPEFAISGGGGDLSLLGDWVFTRDSRMDALSGERRKFPDEVFNRSDYVEIKAGLDGNLYGLWHSRLDELDPETGQVRSTVTLDRAPSSIAAYTDGRLFASLNNELRSYTRSGELLASSGIGGVFGDIELSHEGTVAAGSTSGDVVLLDLDLRVQAQIEVGSRNAFVAWVPHTLTAVSEPSRSPVPEHVRFSYTVRFEHSDPGTQLGIDASGPAWLSLQDHGDGTATISGTPLTDADAGVHEILLTASDTFGRRSSQRFDLTVTAVNDPPLVVGATAIGADEDTPELRVDLNSILGDEEDADLDFALVRSSDPDRVLGSIVIDGDQLVLVPNPDAFGLIEIDLTGTDSGGLSATASLVVDIAPVNDRPAASPIPDITARPDGAGGRYGLGDFFSDIDPGDLLAFSISGNTNPAIFSMISINAASGELLVEYANYVSGTSLVTVRAADRGGLEIEADVTIVLPEIAQPRLESSAPLALNRQTGLFEHRVIVTNAGARAIGGFRLSITDLPASVEAYNVSARLDGARWLVQHDLPVAAGASVEILLEYYSRTRVMDSLPIFTVEHALPLESADVDGTGAFAIDRVVTLREGSVLVEFPTEPGECYLVQFSRDNRIWHDCLVRIRAGGTRVQWIDQGLPKTPLPPSESGSRFYRVIREPSR